MIKDTIVEAADSMREGWEAYKADQQARTAYPLSMGDIAHISIQFVGRLMPEQDAGTIIAIARRLRTG